MEQTSAPAGGATNTINTLCGSSLTPAQSMTQAVAIVLPIALLTVIITATLVGVGIYICLLISRKNRDPGGRQIVQGYENLDASTKSLKQLHSEQDHAINSDHTNHNANSVDR